MTGPAGGDTGGAVHADGPSLITISATYGSGGSVVAPALAQRLRVPCLQRVTTSEGALTEAIRSGERLSGEEARRTPVHHLLSSLAHALPAGPTQSPPAPHRQAAEMRTEAETRLRELADAGAGVILGRAAAVVLGKQRGYHVRLDGPADRRVAQGAVIEHITLEESRAHMEVADGARTAYVQRLYGVDPADAGLYHLVIDSTAISIDAVVEVILLGAREAARTVERP